MGKGIEWEVSVSVFGEEGGDVVFNDGDEHREDRCLCPSDPF